MKWLLANKYGSLWLMLEYKIHSLNSLPLQKCCKRPISRWCLLAGNSFRRWNSTSSCCFTNPTPFHFNFNTFSASVLTFLLRNVAMTYKALRFWYLVRIHRGGGNFILNKNARRNKGKLKFCWNSPENKTYQKAEILHISGQITIIPKPECFGHCWGGFPDFLPPFLGWPTGEEIGR